MGRALLSVALGFDLDLLLTRQSVYFGTATLNASGVAAVSRPSLNADSYPLTATYVGDANHQGSTSSILNQVITETTSAFGLGTSPADFVQYYSGLPNNPNPVGEVLVGSFTAGTIINFGMFTQFGSESGWAFSTGTDQASIVAFADLDNSLGMNHSNTQQTSSTTWLLHLDDALSYLFDDDNNDVLMQIRLAPN